VLHSSGDTDEPTPMWVAGDLAAHSMEVVDEDP
jgi:hypothetical protein